MALISLSLCMLILLPLLTGNWNKSCRNPRMVFKALCPCLLSTSSSTSCGKARSSPRMSSAINKTQKNFISLKLEEFCECWSWYTFQLTNIFVCSDPCSLSLNYTLCQVSSCCIDKNGMCWGSLHELQVQVLHCNIPNWYSLIVVLLINQRAQ